MRGHGGQYVFINKNKKLMVVITSKERKERKRRKRKEAQNTRTFSIISQSGFVNI
jgi:hypothetical protein